MEPGHGMGTTGTGMGHHGTGVGTGMGTTGTGLGTAGMGHHGAGHGMGTTGAGYDETGKETMTHKIKKMIPGRWLYRSVRYIVETVAHCLADNCHMICIVMRGGSTSEQLCMCVVVFSLLVFSCWLPTRHVALLTSVWQAIIACATMPAQDTPDSEASCGMHLFTVTAMASACGIKHRGVHPFVAIIANLDYSLIDTALHPGRRPSPVCCRY
jgi:hypothetical protein